MTRRALFAILTLALCAAATLPAMASPFEPARDKWFASNDAGHWGNQSRVRIDESCQGLPDAQAVECSLKAFAEKPFTVIAFVDSGINPYHEDFRAPEFVHHPSKYIEGYPADAQELPLSLDVADTDGYAAARDADDERLTDLQRQKLYWIPGTRIIGGYSMGAGGAGTYPERVVVDENGHGSGVASVAAGQLYGANPNALIVMVEGLGMTSTAWAASQPWIDIVSNSWGPGLPGRVDLPASVEATRQSTRRGQSMMFSAGNGMRNTNSSDVFPAGQDPCRCKIPTHNATVTANGSGPSWHLTIGAVSPVNGQAHWWHGVPVDAASFGSKWRAADAFGVKATESRDFGGTSCATPITAGVLSSVIEKARVVLGDTEAGQKTGGVVAQAAPGRELPATGPLADGRLTRLEAEAITLKSAAPVAFNPNTYSWDFAVEPTTDRYYVNQGYGVVDRNAKARALSVLVGEAVLPDRGEADTWMATTDRARDAYYGAP